jgi:hypothetical protein
MTAKKDLKSIVRLRMAKTGESYTTARRQVLAEQVRRGLAPAPDSPPSGEDHASADAAPLTAVDAGVLKVNQLSARVRVLDTGDVITFRSSAFYSMVPGQIVSLLMKRRWDHRGSAYASGDVGPARLDVPALGLVPLRLADRGVLDPREVYDLDDHPALKKIWRRAAAPRRTYEMEQVLPGVDEENFDIDSDPIIEASELNQTGDLSGARKILMELLGVDLRCLDAHAHLGNFVLARNPAQALLHYGVGVGIGDQALGPGFTGMLPWGTLDNRPFLRCLDGSGIALWRLGRLSEAEAVFERMLVLNPNDNQGARFNLLDVRGGRSWKEAEERDAMALH